MHLGLNRHTLPFIAVILICLHVTNEGIGMFNLPKNNDLERKASQILRSKYCSGREFRIASDRAISNASDLARIDSSHIIFIANQYDAERFDGLY